MRILLVDDNADLRSTTRELLVDLGHEVLQAGCGDEALELACASKAPVDLLVSDVKMPGLSGVELADQLLAERPKLPVVLMSSRHDAPDLNARLEAGDLAFVAKPFAADSLIAQMARARELAAARCREPVPASVVQRSPQAVVSPRPVNTAEGSAGRRSLVPLAAVAAVATLAAAVWSVVSPATPLLAPPPTADVTRSTAIRPLAPRGPISEAPAELIWHSVQGAVEYAVDLRQIDDTELWRGTLSSSSPEPRTELPPPVRESLQPGVLYYWNVEAFDAARKLLAVSAPIPFSIDLPTLSEGAPPEE